MEEASGKYIWFVDADDDVETDAVPILLEVLSHGSTDGIVFNFEYVKNERKSARVANAPLQEELLLSPDSIVEKISTKLFGLSQRNIDRFFRGEFMYDGGFLGGGAVWQYILNKDLLTRNKLSFRDNLPMGEDCMFLLRYLCLARKMSIVHNLLYNYYERPSGSLIRIKPTPALLFDSKVKLMEERASINDEYMRIHGRNMSHYYDGSLMMSAMELCVKLSQDSIGGMDMFLTYAKLPAVVSAIKRIDTSNAPFKYRVPILMLQRGMLRTLFTLVFVAQKAGYRIQI